MVARKKVTVSKKMLAATKKRSDKLELFCQAYVGTLGNATQAYIMAGYPEKSAQVESSKALSLPMVRERIREIAQDNHDGIVMSKDEVLRELSLIGRGDPIGGMYDENRELLHPTQMDLPTRLNIREVTNAKPGETPIVKFSGDKMAALEKLARHYNIFEDHQTGQANYTVIHVHPADKNL
jgi:phage terminase small subunit